MNHVTRLKPELKALLDRMIEHLATQRQRSTTHDGTCCYRGENGPMCAVGILIPDDLYDDSIEGAVFEIFERRDDSNQLVADHLDNLAPSIPRRELIEFLELIQAYHDNCESSGYTIRLDHQATKTNNYQLALRQGTERLRERIVEGIDAVIDHYAKQWPRAAVGWFA